MVRINVTLTVNDDVYPAIAALLDEMAELSRKEIGCIAYEILQNRRLKDTLMIVETWENESVLAAHKESEHFKHIIPRVREMATRMVSEKFSTTPLPGEISA